MAEVREVTPFNVKVDIGGIQVRISVEEMDWGWIDDLMEEVKVGDHLKVKVVELDKKNAWLSSAKQAKPSPWPECTKRYHERRIRRTCLGRSGLQRVREFGAGRGCALSAPEISKPEKNDCVLMRELRIDAAEQKIR
ncbi:hypothetical protein BSNK01_07550 [Bacillaceae bacterium]